MRMPFRYGMGQVVQIVQEAIDAGELAIYGLMEGFAIVRVVVHLEQELAAILNALNGMFQVMTGV